MVKKFITFLFFIILVFPITTVYAYSTESECINSVNAIADREYALLSDLNDYFDLYRDDLLDIVSYDAIYNTNSFDVESLVTRVISLLNEKGHTAAANDLTTLKPRIVGDYNYIKDEYYSIKEYLDANTDRGFPAIDDILYAIKSSIPRFKDQAKTFFDNYYDLYKEDIKTKFENENLKASDLEALIDKLYDNTFGVAKYRDEFVAIQNYYNLYHMEDYEDLIDDYINDYKSFFDNKRNDILEYLKTYTKKEVNKRVDVYKLDLDESNPESVDAYNAKVLALVDRVDYYLNYYDYKKNTINDYIKIDKYKQKAIEKQTEIEGYFEDLKDYIRTFLINVDYITLKDPANDSDLIIIDSVNHLIIYYEHEDLSVPTLFSKLKATVGTLEGSDLYDETNVGTFSNVVNRISATQTVTFKVIVKGDVFPDGKISSKDYVRIKNHIMESPIITDETLRIAADITDDNKISSKDYVRIKNIIMNRGN